MCQSDPATTETPQADRQDTCVYKQHHCTDYLQPHPGGKGYTMCRQRTQQSGEMLHVIHIPATSEGQDFIVT